MTRHRRWQSRIRIDAPRPIILLTVSIFLFAADGLSLRAEPAVPIGAGAPAGATLVGRLVDRDGMAVAGATILVFRSADPWPADTADASGESMLRTDPDGGFVARLRPGRYTVAAMKDGYDIVLTEAHTLSSRVVRMKMKRSPAAARRPDEERGAGWMFRAQQPDVLRDEDAGGPPERIVFLPPPVETGGAATAAFSQRPGAGFFGSADGEIAQLVGAGLLPGFEGAGDVVRDTTVTLRAPLSESIAWSVAGRSLRNEAPAGDGEIIAGRSDRLALGMSLDGGPGAAVRGGARAGYAGEAAGAERISDRVIEAEGDVRLADSNTRLAVALQAWSTHSDDAEAAGEGAAVYAGSRSRVGDRFDVDYGFEYRADTLANRPRAVPRLGLGYGRPDGDPLTVRADLLLDATFPGARVAIAASPRGGFDVAAALTLLPANALDAIAPAAASDPAFVRTRPAAVEAAGARSADRRSLDLSVARRFGGLAGSLSGSVGRVGRRAVPLVEDAALPVVSYGNETFYETRLGVGYARSATRMEVGYRRVAPDAAEPESTSAGTAWSRMDVLVSQGLPSPRLLSGARLSALVSWQGLDYQRLDAGAGVLLTGLATRLTGGVGLSF